MAERSSTPEPVARLLRQSAGFGCCRCGFPVYQYHHIVPWHVREHFDPDDMMILCPNCHDAATKGALSEESQKQAQSDPYNRRRGYASGALMVGQKYCAIACGGTLLVGDGMAIRMDGLELLRLSAGADGDLQVSLELRDQDGTVLAVVERNEWISGDPDLWDMRSDHDRLKLWTASRAIVLEINGSPSRSVGAVTSSVGRGVVGSSRLGRGGRGR